MTLTKRLTILFTVIVFILSLTGSTTLAKPQSLFLLYPNELDSFDPETNIIRVYGDGWASDDVIDKKDNYEIRFQALQAARLNALRKLSEALAKVISIDYENIIPLNARFIDKKELDDYGYEVIMEISVDAPYSKVQNITSSGQSASIKNIKLNPLVNEAIKSFAVLANIYYYEYNNKTAARNFANQGIELVKKNYTKAEVEALVNGTDVIMEILAFTGNSNPIRDLYVIKSDIEDSNPSFMYNITIKDMLIESDIINNIKYRTDW